MGIGAMRRRPGVLKGKVLLLALGLSLLLASGASADLFMKIDNIQGESQDLRHRNEIDLLSVEWGVSMAKPTTASGASKPVFDDLSWDQLLDKSVPPLFEAIATGRHIDQALITFRKEGEQPFEYFKMEFRDVLLTSLQLSANPTERATVEGSFAYDFIKLTYIPQKPDGSAGTPITADFDLSKNKGSVAALASVFALGMSGPTTVVPIPASVWLLGAGLAGLAGWRRRFRK